MLLKNEIKSYSLLLQKKYRKETGKFLVEGKKLVLEAINSKLECEIIVSTTRFAENLPEFFRDQKVGQIRFETVKQNELEKLSDTKTPQGIIGVFRIPIQKGAQKKSKKIIALENISDPGNLGTIIRSCDWFGFNNIILSDDCAEIYNPKVIRSSAGSVFHINVQEEKSFYESLQLFKKENYKIICADIEGVNLDIFKIPESFVMVFCNEANGPTDKLLSICNSRLTIPKKGKAESLNVASASAVILSKLSNNF